MRQMGRVHHRARTRGIVMRKSRLICGVVAAAMVAVGTAACGSDSSGDSADGLTFMFRGGEDERDAYQAAIDRFTEDTGVPEIGRASCRGRAMFEGDYDGVRE